MHDCGYALRMTPEIWPVAIEPVDSPDGVPQRIPGPAPLRTTALDSHHSVPKLDGRRGAPCRARDARDRVDREREDADRTGRCVDRSRTPDCDAGWLLRRARRAARGCRPVRVAG